VTARRIVRDESIMDGRWHFEGTLVAIGAIRAEALSGVDTVMRTCQRAGLTEAEIRLALDFTFPDMREPELRGQYAFVTVICSCGEETPVTVSGFDEAEALCVCGRCWGVQLALCPISPQIKQHSAQ
jgi:hypothetical protein